MLAAKLPPLSCSRLAQKQIRGATQRRWAQVHDVRFLVTHDISSKIADRYESKLRSKAQAEGLESVAQLKAVYKERNAEQQRQATRNEKESTLSTLAPFSAPPPLPKPSQALTSDQPNATIPGIQTLSSFIDVDKAAQLPPKELEYIWRLRHASDPQSLCAVIPRNVYDCMATKARQHPQFILPIPKEDAGAEIHFLQWVFPSPTTVTVLFTHLAEFKLRGEYAQPHTTATHHLDFREQKDLVLLQGAVVKGKGVTVDQSKWLLLCLQKFYAGMGDASPRREDLLRQFSKGDGSFSVETLLEEAEKVS